MLTAHDSGVDQPQGGGPHFTTHTTTVTQGLGLETGSSLPHCLSGTYAGAAQTPGSDTSGAPRTLFLS